MTMEDTLEQLREFADSRRGWKVYTRDGREPYAGRIFKYRNGHSALLSLRQISASRDWGFEAQVHIPFSVGPEDSIAGSLTECQEWVCGKEKLLTVPNQLESCRSEAQAMRLMEPVGLKGVLLLCSLLDVRRNGSADAVRERIIRAICGTQIDSRRIES